MQLPDQPVPRRFVTIPAYVLAWVTFSVLSPLWLPLLLVVGLVRRRHFVLVRLMVFLWVYFAAEMLGLTAVLGIYMSAPVGRAARQRRLASLQNEWASLLYYWARTLLRLSVHVEGHEQVGQGPVLVFMRHASIIDTLLPAVLVSRPSGVRLRYVLKKELLVDPCLDIVGHALPNYFVDRGGETEKEVAAIRELGTELGQEGVLLYPEGTRFTDEKRVQVLATLSRDRPDLAARAERGSPRTTAERRRALERVEHLARDALVLVQRERLLGPRARLLGAPERGELAKQRLDFGAAGADVARSGGTAHRRERANRPRAAASVEGGGEDRGSRDLSHNCTSISLVH